MISSFVSVQFLLQGQPGGAGLYQFLFQIAAIILILYFLMFRPQQKARKQHEERLRNLKKGDQVVTAGGVIGEVVHVKESQKDGAAQKSMDDHITIKSGDSRMIVERGRIARVTSGEATASPTS
jgi:preprotein translocase subunit YajC